jgi:thiol:disulfide interchange protein DsbD
LPEYRGCGSLLKEKDPMKQSALFLSMFLLLFAPQIAKADLIRAGHVRVELVTENAAVSPGSSFYAALRIVHDAGWHTYWESSTTGYAPSVSWTLPEGVRAGELLHPKPEILMQGGIVDYVHTGDVLLPVMITIDGNYKGGDTLRLKAHAEWLVCEESCVPGDAELALSLPVSQSEPQVTPWAGAIKKIVHLTDTTGIENRWSFHITRVGRTVQIDAKGDGSHAPGRLYFFASAGDLAAQAVQQQTLLPDGTIRLSLPFSQYAPETPAPVAGILTALDGWGLGQPEAFALKEDSGVTPVSGPTRSQTAEVTFLAALGFAILGGLILNLMPCVFPVLGLKVMSFAKLAGKKGRSAWGSAVVFALGVMATLTALAAILLVMRVAGSKLGWGFQLQDPRVLFVGLIIFLLFGLNMAGMFEIGMSATGIGSGSEKRVKNELAGSFFSGILAVIVATPCSAPFLGSAIGYAFARPALELLAVFWAVGVGFSLPYVIFAAFPSLLGLLPKPGAWMDKLKKFLSLLLFATVAYLAWALSPFIGGGFTYVALAGAVLLTVVAAYLYGRMSMQVESSPRGFMTAKVSRIPKTVRIVLLPVLLLVAALYVGWPGKNTFQADKSLSQTPVEAFANGADSPRFTAWRPGLAEKLSAEGRVVWVDFTARWCATCQVNKAVIFSSPEVRRLFEKHRIVALKADWTARDESISRELAKWNRYAVPFNLLYVPGAKPVELPTVLTPGIVTNAIEEATGELP